MEGRTKIEVFGRVDWEKASNHWLGELLNRPKAVSAGQDLPKPQLAIQNFKIAGNKWVGKGDNALLNYQKDI
jgi:hypothetical protein